MAEFDPKSSVFKSGPKSLAALLEAGGESSRFWRADELAAVFRHQLSAPILVDLGAFDPGTATRLRVLSDSQGLLLKSFADLFHHPSPPLELLELTKDFAKMNMDHPESSLSTEIAAALYYASIATALVRLGAKITRLGDADLRRGLVWARGQSWIDAETRELLGRAIAVISSPGAAA